MTKSRCKQEPKTSRRCLPKRTGVSSSRGKIERHYRCLLEFLVSQLEGAADKEGEE